MPSKREFASALRATGTETKKVPAAPAEVARTPSPATIPARASGGSKAPAPAPKPQVVATPTVKPVTGLRSAGTSSQKK